MRVPRSPRAPDGLVMPSLPPTSTNMGTFAVESDTTVFLPKSGDPKEDNAYLEKSSKEEVADSWISQLWQFLLQPFTWISMLCRELDVTFVVGVMVVYGLSQGVGFALNRVVVDYYWRDVQGKEPATVQLYKGVTWIPWDLKPIFGLLTDVLPFFGYHRRPYFVFAGLVSLITYLVLVLGGKLFAATALAMFMGASAASAMADVTIDALVAMKSREKPELATHIQSLCNSCYAIGGLSGYLLGGLAVHAFGSQFALGLMTVPGVLVLVLGFTIAEPRLPRNLWRSGQVGKQMSQACSTMWATLRRSQVWQPTLYMYLSWALSPNIGEGMFYWFNDANVGPGFSQEFVGVIYAMGAVGTLLGVAIYHRYLRHWTFRTLVLWGQLLLALTGMLDFALVTGVNRILLIPDSVFAVVDEAVSWAIGRIKWMPLLVLAAKLCPSGIEGTFFALLMSVDTLGIISSSWVGSTLLKLTGINRSDFKYLWLTILIRNATRLLPLLFLFLVPNTDPDLPLLPLELFGSENPTFVLGSESEDEEESETVRLAALHDSANGATQVEHV